MAADNFLVSVVIPAYNSGLYIREAIDSVLNQTFSHLEIIVIDDGSTDDTLSIAKSFKDERVQVLTQVNAGACAARNTGLRYAKGDFIQYLDADDVLDENKISRQLKMFDPEVPGILFSSTWARFDKSIYEAHFTFEGVFGDFKPVEWLVTAFGMGGMMALHAWLVPRSVADAAGQWNETLLVNQDGEYMCRAVLASQGVKFCPEAKVFYRNSTSARVSSNKSEAAQLSKFRVCELNATHLMDVENSKRTRKACANLFQHYCYKNYPQAGELIEKADEYIEGYGGASVVPGGTTAFIILEKIVGWKKARKMERKLMQFKSSLNI